MSFSNFPWAFCLVLLTSTAFLRSIASQPSSYAPESLYYRDSAIISLKAKDFDSTVLNRPKGLFVQYYSSWCGHCKYFAPIFQKFSSQVANWKRVVEVVAINCALRENTALCRESGVVLLPLIKVSYLE